MRRIPLVFVAMPVLMLAGAVAAGQRSPAAAQEATPDPRDIEATVQRFYDPLNTGDVDSLDDVLAPDWTDSPPPAGSGTDVENFKQAVLDFRAAFPDLVVDTRDFIVEGNQVAVRSTMTGTHEGTFVGVAGTGTSVQTQFIDIHRVEGGRIAETHHVEDLLGVLFQIGAFPPPASPVDGTPAA